jgi:hypothetical protein
MTAYHNDSLATATWSPSKRLEFNPKPILGQSHGPDAAHTVHIQALRDPSGIILLASAKQPAATLADMEAS